MGLAAKLSQAGYNASLLFRSVSPAGCEIPSEEGQGKDSPPEQDRDRGGQEHLESGFSPEQTFIRFSVLEASQEMFCCLFLGEVIQKYLMNCFLKKKPKPRKVFGLAWPDLFPDGTLGVQSMQDIRGNYLLYPGLVNW